MSDSNDQIQLAISTCPNDTFAFHGIINRKIDLEGIDFQVELLDISQLNDGLFSGKFDVAKASFHAALQLADQTVVLPSGSALGFGVGPLLLSSEPDTSPDVLLSPSSTVTLCPGPHTTATLLMKMFYGDAIEKQRTRLEHRVFSEIMPALQNQSADFGVCIHEGRFTWQEEGLHLVEDLGIRWERETDCPLPLGGILARRSLGDDLTGRVQRVIRRSIEYGLANRQETLPTMRQHAQEFNDDVLMQHVDLYVNDWTVDLGGIGGKALSCLSSLAGDRRVGLSDSVAHQLQIWSVD